MESLSPIWTDLLGVMVQEILRGMVAPVLRKLIGTVTGTGLLGENTTIRDW